ncbi:hypothetical protein ACFXAQ_13045 [Streptomyces olivaceus]|uniref:hypothetical protein n=1 Tax=Streptomyces olivaceus TaxID=47716 RepID=UPI0036CEBD49
MSGASRPGAAVTTAHVAAAVTTAYVEPPGEPGEPNPGGGGEAVPARSGEAVPGGPGEAVPAGGGEAVPGGGGQCPEQAAPARDEQHPEHAQPAQNGQHPERPGSRAARGGRRPGPEYGVRAPSRAPLRRDRVEGLLLGLAAGDDGARADGSRPARRLPVLTTPNPRDKAN